MKKKLYLSALLAFCTVNSLLAGGLFNGGFETTGGTENCTGTNFSITRAIAWDGIRIFYTTGNCATPSFATGTASGADLYTAGMTSGCVPGPARSGLRAAHLELRGFYPNQTASAEWARQLVTGTFTAGKSYVITAYLYVTGGPLVVSPTSNYFDIGFRMVPLSAGTGASAIIANAKAQAAQPVTITNDGGGWVKLSRTWTAPTTGSYNLLIGPWAIVFCNDGNYSWLGQYNIDDVSITCTNGIANAGSDKQNTCYFCCNPPVTGVGIGTAAVSGYNYSWSPATGLSATNVAQPVASPCGTTTYTVTATSTGNECPATTDAVVVTTLTNQACCRMSESDIKPPFSFNVYPNPSKDGTVTIDIPADFQQLNITVVSAQNGTTIFSRQFSGLKRAEQLKILLPPKTTQKEERVLVISDPATGNKFSVKLL